MRRTANVALIALFYAGVTAPAVHGLIGKHASPCPTLSRKTLKSFPKDFESYFNDHVGFRADLIGYFRDWKLGLFGLPPSPKILLGEYTWMFHDFPGVHDDGRSTNVRAKVQKWRRVLEARHDWCAARGVACVTAFAPEKQTIYPEFLPPRVRRGVAAYTPHDAIVEAMKDSRARMIDLRPALREGKETEPMYFVRDTHWTSAGAMRADRVLVASLLDHFRGWSFWPPKYAGSQADHFDDLAFMLDLPEARRKEPHYVYRPEVSGAGLTQTPFPDPESIHGRLTHMGAAVFERPDSPGPRVVLVHDSFGSELRLHLAPHCRRLVCLPSNALPTAVIEHEKPDLVILEMAERRLVEPMVPEAPDVAKLIAGR